MSGSENVHAGKRVEGAQANETDDDVSVTVEEPGSVYEAKARVLNAAMQEIGMGRYQWQLFFVIGFGWASDNLWPITTSLIFTGVANEFSPARPPLLSLAQNIGLLAGAAFWGFGCDVFGRRWAFSLTLGITALFGLIAACSPNFAAIATFAALWSFGVGGNLPVDSAILLEFLPGSHQFLLTILSVYWALAQLIATLIAWPLLGNFTCQEGEECPRRKNMGWRYFLLCMGGVTLAMFLIRLLCFTIYESPKYLMGKGKDEEAVKIVHEVARRNGKTSDCKPLPPLPGPQNKLHPLLEHPSGHMEGLFSFWAGCCILIICANNAVVTIDDLRACDQGGASVSTDATAALKRRLEKVNLTHVRALFETRKLSFSTSMIIVVWAFIGLGYPLYNAFLPYIQATRGAEFGDGSTYITYRNSLIIAVLGIPGALLGGYLVEIPRFGRRGTLSLSTVATGAFLYASTTALDSNSLLGWNCAYNFTSNVMYAVLYAYTPEVFITKHRGTGNALTATANRIFGVLSPIIAMFANLQTAAPVYTSGALFIAAGLIVVALPFESQGKASL